ncbi:hypothetical protein B0H10DRAFT_2447760, partial [Mycena sp. CBHHK59/15]
NRRLPCAVAVQAGPSSSALRRRCPRTLRLNLRDIHTCPNCAVCIIHGASSFVFLPSFVLSSPSPSFLYAAASAPKNTLLGSAAIPARRCLCAEWLRVLCHSCIPGSCETTGVWFITVSAPVHPVLSHIPRIPHTLFPPPVHANYAPARHQSRPVSRPSCRSYAAVAQARNGAHLLLFTVHLWTCSVPASPTLCNGQRGKPTTRTPWPRPDPWPAFPASPAGA